MSDTGIVEGYHQIPEEDRKKAQVFFDRGRSVAGTGNFEYAIEMFLQGLRLDPDSQEAHKELRDISLRRKAAGGKSLGFLESLKLKRSAKEELDHMLAAEKLLAYDPGNCDHMLSVGQHALKAGFYDTVLFMGPVLLRGNADSPKPDFNKFIQLRDLYKSLHRWQLASEAAQAAYRLRPEDLDLPKEIKDLSALDTVQVAGYDKKGSFRDQVRDMKSQIGLLNSEKEVNDVDILNQQIAEARKELAADPNEGGKLTKLVDLLVRLDNVPAEEEAIKLLEGFYDKTKQFRYKKRVGEIRMNQLKREEKEKRRAVEADPQNAELIAEYQQFLKDRAEYELAEYALWAEAYPTDMSNRFEMGRRQYSLQRFDEAISSFQAARNDPKFRVDAMSLLGKTFLAHNFLEEADETFAALIRDFPQRDGPRFKDMYYWRGRILEQKGDVNEAIKHYSTVFQQDSSYLDVSARMKRLRGQPAVPKA